MGKLSFEPCFIGLTDEEHLQKIAAVVATLPEGFDPGGYKYTSRHDKAPRVPAPNWWLEPQFLEQVAVSRYFIRTRTRRLKGFWSKGGSYGWKHKAEATIFSSRGYVVNGAFIVAAMLEGCKVKPAGPNDPNAVMNLAPVKGYEAMRSHGRFEHEPKSLVRRLMF